MLRLIALAAAAFVLAAAPPVQAATPEEALDTVCQMDFPDVPLKDVAKFIGDLHEVKVELDEKGLKRAGVSPDVTIKFEADGVKLKTALTDMLKPLKLTHKVDGDKIVITAK